MKCLWYRLCIIFGKPALDFKLIATLLEKIDMDLQELHNQVRDNQVVIGSAIDLLNTLHTRLEAAIAENDQTMIQQLADELKQNTTNLANSVTANTDRPRFAEPPHVG